MMVNAKLTSTQTNIALNYETATEQEQMEQKSIFSIAIFGFESDTLFSYRKSVAKSKITQLGMENFVQVLMEWDLKCCKTNVMKTLKISL